MHGSATFSAAAQRPRRRQIRLHLCPTGPSEETVERTGVPLVDVTVFVPLAPVVVVTEGADALEQRLTHDEHTWSQRHARQHRPRVVKVLQHLDESCQVGVLLHLVDGADADRHLGRDRQGDGIWGSINRRRR